jgi:hypothetical protein
MCLALRPCEPAHDVPFTRKDSRAKEGKEAECQANKFEGCVADGVEKVCWRIGVEHQKKLNEGAST